MPYNELDQSNRQSLCTPHKLPNEVAQGTEGTRINQRLHMGTPIFVERMANTMSILLKFIK